MNFKGHLTGGIIAGAVISLLPLEANYSQSSQIAIFSMTVLGSLFPDIDTHSTPSKWFARVGVISSLYLIFKGYYFDSACIGLIFMFCKMGKHRGWTHSKLFPLSLLLSCYLFNEKDFIKENGLLVIAFSIGLFVHLFLDYSEGTHKKNTVKKA